MKGFTSVQTYPNKKILFQEEIDAVMAMMREILEDLGGRPNEGTIILDGQVKGSGAQCIMRMNLEDGGYRRWYSQNHERTSESLAECSINAILEWPKEPIYGYEAESNYFGELPTGIYRFNKPGVVGSYAAMVLNTSFGRFIMSAHLGLMEEGGFVDCYNEAIALMTGTAVMLSVMCPKDIVLRKSIGMLMKHAMDSDKKARDKVERTMFCCELPELKAWVKWHEDAMTESNGLGVYFE